MVPRAAQARDRHIGFPHARGDGPTVPFWTFTRREFSPRPWGWSACTVLFAARCIVFPTPVGMVPPSPRPCSAQICFPHARGDGPSRRRRARSLATFSPRPWGWSPRHRAGILRECVFPTPVGMVLLWREYAGFFVRFPHARGDGPNFDNQCYADHQFSPRPSGCRFFDLYVSLRSATACEEVMPCIAIHSSCSGLCALCALLIVVLHLCCAALRIGHCGQRGRSRPPSQSARITFAASFASRRLCPMSPVAPCSIQPTA